MKLGKYTMVEKSVTRIAENEVTFPKHSGRYKGVSIGRDGNGFFATTHRARSRSYPSPLKIPDGKIKFIESTG